MNKIEKQWDDFGEKNPYFAVSTHDRFHTENLNDEILEEFFESGEEYTGRIWREIRENLEPDFDPQRSLDFGCGVGRLTLPIARRSQQTVGVDISQKMLDEAEKNARRMNLTNITFIKGDDGLTGLVGEFDFVHSYIVIQHIKPKTGEVIFRRLIELLAENGIGALHLTYYQPGKRSSVFRYKIYRSFPFIYKLRNFLLKQRKEPLIPVYNYDLNRIMEILQANDCHQCFIRFSQHGHLGIHIFFKKKSGFIY